MKPNFLLGGVAGLAILAACQTAPSDDMSDSLEAAETIEVEQVMDAEESVEVEAAVETMKATYKDRVDLVVRAHQVGEDG